jgi:hypothetical protein
VVLLLFIIGLELSPRRLWVMRKSVFGVGLAQVLLTASVIGVLALSVFGQPLNSAIVLGLGLALSSTAFGLQSLAERKELTSPHGRLAFAILLFQDIAAIPLIALVPMLAGGAHDTSAAEESEPRVARTRRHRRGRGRRTLSAASGVPCGGENRPAGSVHRHSVAGGDRHGVVDGPGRCVDGAGGVSRRFAIGGFGISP